MYHQLKANLSVAKLLNQKQKLVPGRCSKNNRGGRVEHSAERVVIVAVKKSAKWTVCRIDQVEHSINNLAVVCVVSCSNLKSSSRWRGEADKDIPCWVILT